MVKVLRDYLSTQTSIADRDHTECPVSRHAKLLFANKTEKDILWRNELDQLAKTEHDRYGIVSLFV